MTEKYEELAEKFKNKWEEICNDEQYEDDPWKEWRKFLDQENAKSYGCEPHLGDALDLVEDLVDLINNKENVIIIDDPSCEGSTFYGILIIKGN